MRAKETLYLTVNQPWLTERQILAEERIAASLWKEQLERFCSSFPH
jgi:hypothetical protein